MAQPSARLPENAPGDFFVDESCIDCDVCRQIAPTTFAQARVGKSFVHKQPQSADERHRAMMALVACPTASIGASNKHGAREAAQSFPEPIADEVYFCGFTSESSFGASSYFVRRKDGNVLVDSPRAARPLMRRIAELGGAQWMFLSHRDDVADHRAFHEMFNCRRILHRWDIGPDTTDIELPLEGKDPVRLAADLICIPVPGHTRGSTALLYGETFLFSGDHLWASDDGDGLDASSSVCWYSWREQLRSIERLMDFRFEWVLPGHGRRFRAASPKAMRGELERLLGRLHS